VSTTLVSRDGILGMPERGAFATQAGAYEWLISEIAVATNYDVKQVFEEARAEVRIDIEEEFDIVISVPNGHSTLPIVEFKRLNMVGDVTTVDLLQLMNDICSN